ncbi:MAG: hypothetical protein C4543_06490 [Ignavibacteriales bacterium]|nr:hypothetical protein [Melioribacteraceae bacterium]RJP59580.1 MAG: hypothetical protein C4543_06490 [Ignavibacteriales bacterium]
MKNKIIVMIFILFASFYSQEFYVDYQKTEGELTSKDLYRSDFGRYDGYQMQLNKGERVHFIVYSNEFSPSLIVVTPQEKKYQQVSAKGEDFVTLGFKVPESGEWVLYVVGDSISRGDYLLQTAFADSASLFLSSTADFCTGLKYLLAHSNAYFIFPQTVPSSRNLYQIKGAMDSFINGDDPSYNASFYQGDDKSEADKEYKQTINLIEKCLTKGWKKKVEKDNLGDEVIEETISWTEQVSKNPREIRLSLSDFSQEQNADLDPYSVDMIIIKY